MDEVIEEIHQGEDLNKMTTLNYDAQKAKFDEEIVYESVAHAQICKLYEEITQSAATRMQKGQFLINRQYLFANTNLKADQIENLTLSIAQIGTLS